MSEECEYYANLKPRQRLGLLLGSRTRFAKALFGNAKTGNRHGFNTFTQQELDLIETIQNEALERARKNYEEDLREVADAEASGRVEAEPRQYTGK